MAELVVCSWGGMGLSAAPPPALARSRELLLLRFPCDTCCAPIPMLYALGRSEFRDSESEMKSGLMSLKSSSCKLDEPRLAELR